MNRLVNGIGVLAIPVFSIVLSCTDGKRSVAILENIPEASIATTVDSTFRTFHLSESDDKDFLKKEVSEIELIPLETREDCVIGRISDMKIFHDKIVVVDGYKAQRIYLFDMNGKYIRSIGNKGEGPGEYASINSIDIHDGGVDIRDWLTQKYIGYDYSGNCRFERSMLKTSPENVMPLNDSVVAGTYAGYYPGKPYQLEWIVNDSIRDTAMPFRTERSFAAGSLMRSERGVLFLPDMSDTIYMVDPDRLSAIYSFGLYEKGEMENYLMATSELTDKEFMDDLNFGESGVPVNSVDYKEFLDRLFVEFQKNGKQHISIVDKKDSSVRSYKKSDNGTREIPVPFIFFDDEEYGLSSCITEEFEIVGDEDRRRVYDRILDPSKKGIIENYDFESNNPIICRFKLKK